MRKGILRACSAYSGALFSFVVIVVFFVSFYGHWPLWEDHGIFHRIVFEVSQGLRPYVDIPEFNWPGIYGIHYLARLISGSSAVGLRVLDSIFVFSACFALLFILREAKAGFAVRLLCVSAYLLSYYMGGMGNTAQHESFAAPAILLGLLPWIRGANADQPVSVPWYIASGIGMATGVLIKPTVWPLGFVAVLWAVWRELFRGQTWVRLIACGAGGCVPVLLAGGWLWKNGAVEGFWRWGVHFTSSSYSTWQLSPGELALYIVRNVSTRGSPFCSFLFVVALISWFAANRKRADKFSPSRLMIFGLAILVASVAIVWMQYKGTVYHCIPLQWAFALNAGIILVQVPWAQKLELRKRTVLAWCTAGLFMFALFMAGVGMQRPEGGFWRPWSWAPTPGTQLGRQMKSVLRPRETAVVFDYQGQNILVALERVSPYPYPNGMYVLLSATYPHNPLWATLLEELELALQRPEVRFYVFEEVQDIWPEAAQLVKPLLNGRPVLQHILNTQFHVNDQLSSRRFMVYEKKRDDKVNRYESATTVHLPSTE